MRVAPSEHLAVGPSLMVAAITGRAEPRQWDLQAPSRGDGGPLLGVRVECALNAHCAKVANAARL
eukprot:5597324-Prymnesium_polylepis.1